MENRGEQTVRQFAGAMVNQLELNKSKGDWRGRPVNDSLWQIVYHFAKLVNAVKAQELDPITIQEYAADVGNEAMILADNMKVLEGIYNSSHHAIEKGDAMALTEELVDVLVEREILPPGFEAPASDNQPNPGQLIEEALNRAHD